MNGFTENLREYISATRAEHVLSHPQNAAVCAQCDSHTYATAELENVERLIVASFALAMAPKRQLVRGDSEENRVSMASDVVEAIGSSLRTLRVQTIGHGRTYSEPAP